MDFKKYQHVEKIDREEVEGLLDGEVYVFPKIDGRNTTVFLKEDGTLGIGGRNLEVTTSTRDTKYLYDIYNKGSRLLSYLKKHPTHRLFMEYMQKQNIKYYDKNVWGKYFIFDVVDDNNDSERHKFKYLSYDEYKPLLDEFRLPYVPLIKKCLNPTIDELVLISNTNRFLIPEEESRIGEGIVCKRYDFKNQYGNTVWGKLIHDEYYNKNYKLKTSDIYDKKTFHEEIIIDFFTDAFVKKEYAKILDLNIKNKKEFIGRVYGTLYKTFIEEELYHIIKNRKNPTIDFTLLKELTMIKIKEIFPDLEKEVV